MAEQRDVIKRCPKRINNNDNDDSDDDDVYNTQKSAFSMHDGSAICERTYFPPWPILALSEIGYWAKHFFVICPNSVQILGQLSIYRFWARLVDFPQLYTGQFWANRFGLV